MEATTAHTERIRATADQCTEATSPKSNQGRSGSEATKRPNAAQCRTNPSHSRPMRRSDVTTREQPGQKRKRSTTKRHNAEANQQNGSHQRARERPNAEANRKNGPHQRQRDAETSTGRACKRQQSVAATHRAERTHPCRSGVTSTRQLVVHRKRLRDTHQQRQLPGEEGTHLRRSGGLGTRHTTSPSPHTLLQVIRRTKRRICFDLAATFCRNKKKAVAVSGRQHGLGDFSVLRWQKIILQR